MWIDVGRPQTLIMLLFLQTLACLLHARWSAGCHASLECNLVVQFSQSVESDWFCFQQNATFQAPAGLDQRSSTASTLPQPAAARCVRERCHIDRDQVLAGPTIGDANLPKRPNTSVSKNGKVGPSGPIRRGSESRHFPITGPT